jgi:hypothetical protein
MWYCVAGRVCTVTVFKGHAFQEKYPVRLLPIDCLALEDEGTVFLGNVWTPLTSPCFTPLHPPLTNSFIHSLTVPLTHPPTNIYIYGTIS